MLILKGNAGKDGVVQAMQNSNQALVYVYYDEWVVEGSYFVSSKNYSINEFVDSAKKDIFANNYHPEYLVIYTNLENDTDIDIVSNFAKECEENGLCRFSMITCK